MTGDNMRIREDCSLGHGSSKMWVARAAVALVALATVLLAWPSRCWSQATYVGGGNPQDKPAKIDSYITAYDGKRLWDDDPGKVDAVNLPSLLNTFPGPTVDLMMAQCFSGGFASGMNSAIQQYTFTAAANWNELAYSTPTMGDNFTKSWVQSFPRNEGLLTHYTDTVSGAAAQAGPPARAAVTADPYGPKGASRTAKYFENPVFASPDALVNGNPDPNGANNSRDAFSSTYAVLMAPYNTTLGADTPRFQTDIDRVYNALIGIGVPANQIIVLYGGKFVNFKTAGDTPINGQATYANIVNAAATGAGLYGDIRGQTAPAAPTGTSHLLVYVTGHGRSWDQTGASGRLTKPVNPGLAGNSSYDVNVTDMPANAFAAADGSDSLQGSLDLQLYSTASDLAGTALAYDGVAMGQLAADPVPECDLTGMIGTSYVYDIAVPLTFLDSLGSPGTPVDLTLGGGTGALPDSDAIDGLIEAVTFGDYGDDWSVGVEDVPVPEPASVAVVLLGCLPLFRRRSRVERLIRRIVV
jgi:hypothetical protein